ncbi:RHS repeat domain-containing protein [Prevotella bivia]|uniref:RHS repeat domain-containing protein n=1 Tax=Prevotella bivia TaxID=28125 RepID=UPI0037422F34
MIDMCGGKDIIEQRTYLKYCNGAETFFSYDPQRRRLQNLVVNAKAGTIMDNAYSYDAVSNVLGVKNNAPLPQSGKAGGQMSHSYTYDPLYRLANATGTYKGTDNKTASYTLAMGYDNMHRITSKKQHLSQTGVQFGGTLNAGYELAYTYGSAEGKKFQLDNVRDINYRTEETPTDSTNINNGHKYAYDLNGNLVYINTSRVKRDGKEDEKVTEQKYRWDEENRLLAADENGFVSNYWYDADGERTVKTSGENEAIYVNYRASRVQCQVCLSIAEAQPIITESNSEFSGGNTGTARFSLYVSPYLVAGQGGKYTKHIYVGSQRIVSKLGDLASYGADPRRIPYAGKEADGITINYKDKYNQQLQSIKDNYKAFDQPYNGKDNDDYVNGQVCLKDIVGCTRESLSKLTFFSFARQFCCNDGTPEAARARAMNASTRAAVDNNFHDKDNYEKMQFYYHPDHLGSSSYITNLDGEVSQHIEYVPFGEVFIEERNNTWNTPYLFNAKELDEETGMYYYGARYYEPRLSLWMSTDLLEEKNYGNSSYAYTYNPITFIDPIGTDTINISYVNKKWKIDAPIIADGNDVFNVANGDKKETYEFSQGEHGKRVNLLNLEIGETKDSYTLGVYHISGEADNGTGFYVAPGGEPSTKNGSGRRIPDGTYPIINPTAGSQWIKPGVGGNVSNRGIRFHYGGTNPRSWTEGCFVLSSGYSVNGNTIHYNADESKTASRNFDNALGAIGHFSYRPKSRSYNREGATFNAPIKHTLILKSRKK